MLVRGHQVYHSLQPENVSGCDVAINYLRKKARPARFQIVFLAAMFSVQAVIFSVKT